MLNLVLLIVTSIVTPFALAGGLSAPTSFPSANVLPQGVRNFTYKGVYGAANDQYSNNGSIVGVGHGFNKVVTFQDLIENENPGFDQASAEAKVLGIAKTVGETKDTVKSAVIGQTTGKVNVEVNAHVPVFAYGLTKRLTTAIAIPIVHRKYSVDVGAVSNETLQKGADAFTKAGQGTVNKAQEIQSKFQNAVVNKLSDYHYKPLSNGNYTHIGDIRLINKFQALNTAQLALAIETTVALPTGRQADVNKKVDVGSGDRQTDITLGVSSDFFVFRDLTLTAALSYTAQLPDHLGTRVPEEVDSKISPDVDNETRRDLGDITSTQVAAKYVILNGLTLSSAYSFQYKERDKYEGSAVDPGRYHWLGEESRQRMHAAQIGMSYSTVPLFRKQKFFLPMEAALGYTQVLNGKNVVKDPLTTLDLRVFF